MKLTYSVLGLTALAALSSSSSAQYLSALADVTNCTQTFELYANCSDANLENRTTTNSTKKDGITFTVVNIAPPQGAVCVAEKQGFQLCLADAVHCKSQAQDVQKCAAAHVNETSTADDKDNNDEMDDSNDDSQSNNSTGRMLRRGDRNGRKGRRGRGRGVAIIRLDDPCYNEKVTLGKCMDSTLSADMDALADAQEALYAAEDAVDMDMAVANTIGYQGVEVNTTSNSTGGDTDNDGDNDSDDSGGDEDFDTSD